MADLVDYLRDKLVRAEECTCRWADATNPYDSSGLRYEVIATSEPCLVHPNRLPWRQVAANG